MNKKHKKKYRDLITRNVNFHYFLTQLQIEEIGLSMVIREGRMNEKRLITNKRISYHNCYANIIIMAQLLTDDTLMPSYNYVTVTPIKTQN